MTDVLEVGEHGRVERVDAPDARWWELLAGVTWGTTGLLYRLPDPRATFGAWRRAAWLQLVNGGELVAVFVLVPRTFSLGGVQVRAWYRSMLAVRAGEAGRGAGAFLAGAARRAYLDPATEPTLLYGFIEADNERSLRLQRRLGYTEVAAFEATTFGWLWPRDSASVERATEADLPALRALWGRARAGHVLDDLDQSLHLEDVYVTRRGGTVVAAAQMHDKDMEIVRLPGAEGGVLLAMGPLLRRISPAFAMNPHRIRLLAHVAYEAPADFIELARALQARGRSSSLVWYADPRSPTRRALSDLGPVYRMASSPTLRILAGTRHVPEEALAALRDSPLVLSSLDQS